MSGIMRQEKQELGWKFGNTDDECFMDKMLDFWKKKKDELHK